MTGRTLLYTSRAVAPYLLGLATAGLLLTVGQLPNMAPPCPQPISDTALAAERKHRTIDPAKLGKGTTEAIAIRLLDHLKTAQRVHPELVGSYRRLARGKGVPGHWRHYIDPWSGLPTLLQPLRVQMNFAFQDVRAYARPPG